MNIKEEQYKTTTPNCFGQPQKNACKVKCDFCCVSMSCFSKFIDNHWSDVTELEE